MRLTLRRSLAAAGATTALLGGALLAPSLAGAQASPTLTASPTTVVEGSPFTFTFTGCAIEGADEVAVGLDLFDNVAAFDVPVDEDGNATFVWTNTEGYALTAGSYTFTGYCYEPGTEESGFAYEQQPVITVTAAPASTTTSTTAPAAAAAANVAPAFTG